MLQIESLGIGALREFFPESQNWNLITISPSREIIIPTQEGSPIRCIDYRFGMQPDPNNSGKFRYVSETVPHGPAWFGALDGVAALYNGTPERRYRSATRRVLGLGHRPATHGDYTSGDLGCAFVAALVEGVLDGLEPISIVERRALRKKLNVGHNLLYPANRKPKGFLINPHLGFTGQPNGGEFYCIDIGFAEMVGIKPERALSLTAKCGELLLPASRRNLYIVGD